MSSLAILLLCLLCVSATLSGAPRDNINVDKLLIDLDALVDFIHCLVDTDPCTPEYADFKSNIPAHLANGCATCSEVDKRLLYVVGKKIIDISPHAYGALKKKFDPESKYEEDYKAKMKAYNG